MHTLLLYVLKMMLCAALFYGYYFFFLRNERFHYYNRFYLLAGYILSLLIPLPELNWFTVESNSGGTIALLNILHQANGNAATEQTTSFSWQSMILYVSLCISIVLLITLIYRIIKIIRLKHQYDYISLDDFDLINTEAREAPFSFMKNLFWRNDIDLNDTTGKQIMQHEITHIRQKHTWDKLFVESLLCLCWFNPFFWLMRKELWMIHEFIADQESVKDRDASAFAAMLLQSQYGKSIFAPAQSFAYSPIKRRLLMLTTSKQAKYSYTRKMMILPTFAAIVILFACKLQQKQELVKAEVVVATDTAQHAGKDTLNTQPAVVHLKLKPVPASQIKTAKSTAAQYTANRPADQQHTLALKSNLSKALATTTTGQLSEVKVTGRQDTISTGNTATVRGLPGNTKMDGSITIKSAQQQQPLYVVDGEEMWGIDLVQMSPADIESISVLKDEAARSRYGNKGNNGVIIIQTKKSLNDGKTLQVPQQAGRVLSVKTIKDN